MHSRDGREVDSIELWIDCTRLVWEQNGDGLESLLGKWVVLLSTAWGLANVSNGEFKMAPM